MGNTPVIDLSAGLQPAPAPDSNAAPSGTTAPTIDLSAGLQPSQAAQATPQTQPKPDTGVLAGAKRNTVDALTGLWHAFNQPATDEEKAALLQKVREANARGDKVPEELATNPSRATLALHRILDAPADELLKKGRDEVGVAQDLIANHKYWKGGNLYLSGLADKALSGVPLIGPVIGSIASRGEGALIPAVNKKGDDVPASDVPAEQKDLSGAATDVGAMVALEHAPKIVKGAGKTATKAAEAVSDAAGKAADKINQMEVRPDQFRVPEEPAKPVTPHTATELPLDDATIRKSFDKNLSADARQTLREHAGDTVPAGSSVENALLKAVRPTNEAITQQGLALNKVLQDAPHFDTTPAADIQSAVSKLKSELPGGTEDTFGRAVDKEVARAKDVMQSSDPVEINNYIRELDKRINSYTSPEEPLNNPSDAADATRVTIRRALRDKLNAEIPDTKPINDVLGRNLEVRNALRKKYGDVAYDSVQADAQHTSELNKGLKYLEYEKTAAQVQRNLDIAKSVLKTLGYSIGGGTVGGAIIKHMVP